MNRILSSILTIAGLTLLVTTTQPPLPQGHPTTAQPPLPQGHPTSQPQLPPGHENIRMPKPWVPGDPVDVGSVEGILNAYYESISGPKGQPRDWDRFRSLFVPDAMFITKLPGATSQPMMQTSEEYILQNQNYFVRGGYFEIEIYREIDEYGLIGQAFSTFESRRGANEAPYSRGVNSFQFVSNGTRWWITTITWQLEREDVGPIPPQYLPTTTE